MMNSRKRCRVRRRAGSPRRSVISRAERADRHAGREIAEHGAEPDALEQRRGDDGAAEQEQHFGIDRSLHCHVQRPSRSRASISLLCRRPIAQAWRNNRWFAATWRNHALDSTAGLAMIDQLRCLQACRPRRRSGRSRQPRRRRRRRRGRRARPLDERSVRLGKVESDRNLGERRYFARCSSAGGSPASRPPPLGPRRACRTRGRDGEGFAGGSVSGTGRSGGLVHAIRDLDLFDATEIPAERLKRGCACRRGGRAGGEGRHQFGRRRRQRRSGRAGARHVARLSRPVLGSRFSVRRASSPARAPAWSATMTLVAPAFCRS